MSATSHEAPHVLDGLPHHGTALGIGTHCVDTGGASDHVFILCAVLGIQFCPACATSQTVVSLPSSWPPPAAASPR